MVVKRSCSFCAREIEPGTGSMFVKRDGTVFHFCSSSCRKQQLNLGRVGHRFKWTRAHELRRASDRSTAQKAPATAAAKLARGRPARRAAPPATTAASAPAAPATPVPRDESTRETPAESPKASERSTAAPAPKPRRPRKKPTGSPPEAKSE